MTGRTYQEIFELHGFNVMIVTSSDKDLSGYSKEPVLANLFLEVIHQRFIDAFPAKYQMIMPNYELFRFFDVLSQIDVVLNKIKISHKLFDFEKRIYGYTYNNIYTKFTTHILQSLRSASKTMVKDSNLFVHLAGKSPFKNTINVVKCWINNKGFLRDNPNVKLVVSCRKDCLNRRMRKELQPLSQSMDVNGNKVYTWKNLTIYDGIIPDEEYHKLLLNASVAICPSEKEGYGHYINEARYFKTCVITVDHDPMNEHILDGVNGLLLKDKSRYKSVVYDNDNTEETFTFTTAFPSINEMAQKIRYCIKNPDLVKKMGEKSYEMYRKDKEFLFVTITKLIKKLKKSVD